MDNSFVTGFQARRRRRKRIRLIRFFLLVLVVVVSSYVIFRAFVKNYINDSIKLISPVSFGSATGYSGSNIKNRSLDVVVRDAIEGAEGTYAVVIKNFKTGESYLANEHKVFESGSLYKLWVMATAYQLIQSGQLTPDQVLSDDIASLNETFNIDPAAAELKEGTITLTVRSALTQMITISHNYAALLLTEKIKLSKVATFLQANGFTESTVGTGGDLPKTTPSDIALFLEKLYKGEFADEQYTKEMIDLLKNQKLNDGLPKYLPDKSMIANKTGDIGWDKHDAGLVYAPNGDYVIVVFSQSNFPEGAQERIAKISKSVYEYFIKI